MVNTIANKPVIEVDDYYDTIHRKTWTRRTAGFLAGGTLGAAYGAVVGTVAAFLPFALGALGFSVAAPVALPGITAIASSVAVFSSIMAIMGMAVGSDVTANCASIAMAMTEKEKKGKTQEVAEAKVVAGPPSPPLDNKKPPIYGWKAGVILAPLFGAFGALIACNPLTASTIASLSFTGGAFAPQSAAAIASSTILFGVAGSLMAFRNSMIHNKLSNFYMDVLAGGVTDKLLGKAVEKEKSAPSPQMTADLEVPSQSFALGEKKMSLQAILERREETDIGMRIR